MGLLDNSINKSLPQVQSGVLTSLDLSSTGFLGPGSIDKRSYNRIDFTVAFSGSGTHKVRLYGNTKNSSLGTLSVYNSEGVSVTDITADGRYYYYSDRINYIRFYNNAAASGDTVTIEYYLKNWSYSNNLEKLVGMATSLQTLTGKDDFQKGTLNLDLSSGGYKGAITSNSRRNGVLYIRYVLTGSAKLEIAPTNRYNPKLTFYNTKGEVFHELTATGDYFIDVSGVEVIEFYCPSGGTGASATLTYHFGDAPAGVASLRPIQLLYSADKTTAAATTSYTLYDYAISKDFKYFFVAAYYELNGTAKEMSIQVLFGDSIKYTSGGNTVTRSFNGQVLSCDNVSYWNSGFVENLKLADTGNIAVKFLSTPVADAVLHIRIYGVR